MISDDNQHAIEGAGLSFILGARIPEVPYMVKKWREAHPDGGIPDGHVFAQPWPATHVQKAKGRGDKLIYYQYKADRVRRTLRGIDEHVAKAESAVAGKVSVKRWRIEKSSRMSKHDLKVRKIYHHKRESHLTIVFAALAITGSSRTAPAGRSRSSSAPHAATSPSRSAPASTSSPPRIRYPRTHTTPLRRSPEPVRTNLARLGSTKRSRSGCRRMTRRARGVVPKDPRLWALSASEQPSQIVAEGNKLGDRPPFSLLTRRRRRQRATRREGATMIRNIAAGAALASVNVARREPEHPDQEEVSTTPRGCVHVDLATSSSCVTAANFRSLMSTFPSGVAVVTTFDEAGRPCGMTCSSLCSVSLTPPTLLVCLRSASPTLRSMLRRDTFAVNLLRDGARSVAELFACGDPDRFDRVVWHAEPHSGGPHLTTGHAHAVADCRITRAETIGDQTVVFGEVFQAVQTTAALPLLYGLRQYSVWPDGEADMPGEEGSSHSPAVTDTEQIPEN